MRITGKGGGKDLNLIVTGYDGAVAKNDKGEPARHYLDVQRDLRDPAAAGEPNPHAATYTNDKGRVGNGVGYSPSQTEKLVAAMKESGNYRYNEERSRFEGTIKANVFSSDRVGPKGSSAKGVIINTAQPLEASDYGVDEKTMDDQFAMAAANREAAKEAKAAEAKGKESQEAEAPEVPEVETPEAAAEEKAEKPKKTPAKKAPAKSTAKKEPVKKSTAKAAEAAEADKDQPDVG